MNPNEFCQKQEELHPFEIGNLKPRAFKGHEVITPILEPWPSNLSRFDKAPKVIGEGILKYLDSMWCICEIITYMNNMFLRTLKFCYFNWGHGCTPNPRTTSPWDLTCLKMYMFFKAISSWGISIVNTTYQKTYKVHYCINLLFLSL